MEDACVGAHDIRLLNSVAKWCWEHESPPLMTLRSAVRRLVGTARIACMKHEDAG
jgi:hypothetical protein